MKGVLGGLIALILIAGGLRFVYSRVISAATTDTDTSTCLMLEGNTTTVENGVTYITGTVRNDCDRGFSNVTVTFQLLGDDTFGQQTAMGYARGLVPHGTVPFQTQGIHKYEGHRLEAIRGF
jgi:hypothetical protein